MLTVLLSTISIQVQHHPLISQHIPFLQTYLRLSILILKWLSLLCLLYPLHLQSTTTRHHLILTITIFQVTHPRKNSQWSQHPSTTHHKQPWRIRINKKSSNHHSQSSSRIIQWISHGQRNHIISTQLIKISRITQKQPSYLHCPYAQSRWSRLRKHSYINSW